LLFCALVLGDFFKLFPLFLKRFFVVGIKPGFLKDFFQRLPSSSGTQ